MRSIKEVNKIVRQLKESIKQKQLMIYDKLLYESIISNNTKQLNKLFEIRMRGNLGFEETVMFKLACRNILCHIAAESKAKGRPLTPEESSEMDKIIRLRELFTEITNKNLNGLGCAVATKSLMRLMLYPLSKISTNQPREKIKQELEKFGCRKHDNVLARYNSELLPLIKFFNQKYLQYKDYSDPSKDRLIQCIEPEDKKYYSKVPDVKPTTTTEASKLAETKKSTFRKSVKNATTNLSTYDKLNNNQPYDSYRFGVALAGSPDIKMDKTGPSGSDFVMLDYSEADAKIRKGAEKTMGVKPSTSTGKKSKELPIINTSSPIAKSYRNKYGV